MSARICRIAQGLFLLAFAFALVILAIGTFGLFGQPQDPLSGVFLIPLGLPWNHLGADLPDPAPLIIGLAAPAINLLLICAVCAMIHRRS